MGDRFQVSVGLDASEADAGRLARRVVDRLVAEGIVLAGRTGCVPGQPPGHPPGRHRERAVTDDWDVAPWDGLAVHTRRTGFTSGADMPGAALCPRCGAHTPLRDAHRQRFSTAMRTWYGTGAATVEWPTCAHAVPVPDRTWDEAPIAFGTLGFAFWNRPGLTGDFRARPAGLLDGHRTAHVRGKIRGARRPGLRG